MTAPFLSPGFRATDSDDNPLAGGYINFYAAGTTTPKAVYSDADLSTSLGTTVNLNSAGAPVSGSNTPVLIYPGLGDYKIRYYDADDVLVFEFDDYPGAVAEEEAATTATPVFPVVSKTTSYVVTSDDRGKLINANPTGGSFSITLPSAVTVGDNFLIGIRHNGTANAVSVLSTGSQNIRFQGNRTAFSLNGQGETLWLISDGSDWIGSGYVPPFRKDLAPYFIVLDRLTSPPANPDAGARYLINGTPSGAWSTLGFADEDIAEADGNGSWIKHTPDEGWMAFDADEKISLVFKDGAWENFQIDPGESTLKTFIVQDQKASNTDGGTATTDAWTTAVLNTSVVNTITDASLASNKITLPAGRYRVRARKVFSTTGETRIRFKKDVAGTVVGLSESVHAGNVVSTQSANAIVGVTAALECEFEIAESTDFVLEYYVNVNQHTTSTQGLGIPSNISGVVEVYATVTVEDIAAQQGPTGPQGITGEGGLDAAYAYQLNTATSGDPGAGKIRTNHATPASVTQIAVHQTDANGADLAAVIATWDDSTNPTSKARIRWHKEGAPQNFFEFLITGTGTDAGDYWTFPVSYVSHGGTISNSNDIALLVVQAGDQGDPGTTVPSIPGLTEDTAPDAHADFLITSDTSAAAASKKALPENISFIIPSGLAVRRKLAAKLGDAINILDFEAVGDGATDDSQAFNDYTDWIRGIADNTKPPLVLGSGGGTRRSFLLSDTWDLTQLRIVGGMIYGNNSLIIGQTGGAPVIDLLDSEHIDINDLSIFGHGTGSPDYGMMIGRGLTGNGAAYMALNNIRFTGSYTGACVINSAAEIFSARKCHFWNSDGSAGNACYIADGQRAVHLTSQFFTVTQANDTVSSHNDQLLDGCSFEKLDLGGDGYAIKSYGTARSHVYRTCYGQNEYGALIYRKGDHYNCEWDIHGEATNLLNYMVIDAPNASTTIIQRDKISEYYMFTTDEPIKGTGGTGTVNFENSEIDIDYTANDVALVDENGTTINFHGTIKLGDANNAGIYDLSGFSSLQADVFTKLAASNLTLPSIVQVRAVCEADGFSSYYGPHHVNGSLHLKPGANLTVVSTVLTIPNGAGSSFYVASGGDINQIVVGAGDDGRIVRLIFGYTGTLYNDFSNGTFLAGDYSFVANYSILLHCRDGVWGEVSRCANVVA